MSYSIQSDIIISYIIISDIIISHIIITNAYLIGRDPYIICSSVSTSVYLYRSDSICIDLCQSVSIRFDLFRSVSVCCSVTICIGWESHRPNLSVCLIYLSIGDVDVNPYRSIETVSVRIGPFHLSRVTCNHTSTRRITFLFTLKQNKDSIAANRHGTTWWSLLHGVKKTPAKQQKSVARCDSCLCNWLSYRWLSVQSDIPVCCRAECQHESVRDIVNCRRSSLFDFKPLWLDLKHIGSSLFGRLTLDRLASYRAQRWCFKNMPHTQQSHFWLPIRFALNEAENNINTKMHWRYLSYVWSL